MYMVSLRISRVGFNSKHPSPSSDAKARKDAMAKITVTVKTLQKVTTEFLYLRLIFAQYLNKTPVLQGQNSYIFS
jgi:hypothetical protein